MEMQKYGWMLKTSSFGAILLAYDILTHEGAQNEPNLPLWAPAGPIPNIIPEELVLLRQRLKSMQIHFGL